MFDFNKPKIEITEISEDKKFGKIRSRASGKRLWYYTWQFSQKNYAVLPPGSSSKPGEDRWCTS